MGGNTENVMHQKVADILIKFLNDLPVEERKPVTNSLMRLRERLNDVISSTNPIAPFLAQIKQLRLSFIRIPLFLRGNLKTTLVDGLEASISGPSVSLSIFAICLCLMEFNVLRNSDHSDLEGNNILNTIAQLNGRVIPDLTKRVLNQRTNLPSLLSWSLCILAFTYRACLEWLMAQNYSLPPGHDICISEQVRKHPSVPSLMQIALEAQSKRRAYFTPNFPHLLMDMMFANATTNNTGHLAASKIATKYNSSKCPLELDEPVVHPTKLANRGILESCHIKLLTTLPDSFQQSLKDGTPEELCSNLKLLQKLAFEIPDISTSPLLDEFMLTLQSTPLILTRLKRSFLITKPNSDTTQLRTYEEVHCLLLKLWFYAIEQRILLKYWSQSYAWLVAFMYPNYAMMTLDGFVEIILWTARVLTAYQSCFRAVILASPHWFLQMITDAIIELINRSEKTYTENEKVEEALTMCIVAISRPFSALHAYESDVRRELSRVIKVPLESILARMATCRLVSDNSMNTQSIPTASSKQPQRSRPAIPPKMRELLLHHLLCPMLRMIDPWALGQVRVGMRPASARALLKQILTTAENVETSWDGVQVFSKLELPKANPAVGGLHITEKLSLKRKR